MESKARQGDGSLVPYGDRDTKPAAGAEACAETKGNHSNYAYIVRCADGTLYTGWTTDLERRVREHNGEESGGPARDKGAKYTRSRRPVTLVYYEVFETKEEAMRREYAIKHMTKKKKETLVRQRDGSAVSPEDEGAG